MNKKLSFNLLFIKSKSFCFIIILFAGFFTNSLKAQTYCASLYTTGCDDLDLISYFELNTLINNSGAICTATNSPIGYNDFTSLSSTTLTPGQSYQTVVGSGYGSAGVNIWIDYNDDGIFDPSETIGSANNLPANSNDTFFVNIPMSATPGTHRLRLRLVYNESGNSIDPCASYNYGECEDYTVYVQALLPCAGVPAAGYATSSIGLVCQSTSFNLDLSNSSVASGLLYQWQSSLNGTTWANLGTAQFNRNYTVSSITANTYYQCIVTCTNSGQSSISTPIIITLKPLQDCYCVPNYSLNCSGDNIIDFSLANVILQQTGCDLSGYSDSTASNHTIINLNGGQNYTLQANIANSTNGGDMAAGAWIDFNQNGLFETDEFTSLGFGGAQTYTNQIIVPINVANGLVRMRLRVDAYYAGSYTILDPCTNYNSGSYGQIIDYKVNLIAAPLCSGTPTIANAISTKTAVCENVAFSLDITNNDISTGIEYQWQSSTNGTTWLYSSSAQQVPLYTIASQSVTTYYRCISTCTVSALTSTSTPIVVNQNLATNCYCEPEALNCNNVSFSFVLLETLNDSPTCNSNGYFLNTTNTVTLNANQTYSISTSRFTQSSVKIGLWIDYNQNGYFENNEFSEIPTPSAGTSTANISIPFTALGGNTMMRLKIEQIPGTATNTLEPCTNSSYDGQVLDYLVNIVPTASCTGASAAGNATSSVSAICENIPFTLNLANNSIASHIIYQWQYSSDNATWLNLGSSQSYVPYTIASQTATTYYRCLTSCSTGTVTSTSTTWTVTQKVLADCYCIPPPSLCNNGVEIIKVKLSTLTNTSSCGVDGYTNYIGSVPSVSLTINKPDTLTVKVGDDYDNYVSVWIDYDQSGEFDASEYTQIGSVSSGGDSTVFNTITVPSNALLGNTRMRVRTNSFNYLAPYGACTESGPGDKSVFIVAGDGETEDYMVTILQQNCITVNTPSNVAVTADATICFGEVHTIDLLNTLPYSNLTYQWKVKTGSTFINEGTVLNASSTVVTPTLSSYYYCEVNCNGAFWFNSDTMYVLVKPSTSIYGMVTTNTVVPVAGNVTLYKYEPFYTTFQAVATQTINATGNYMFTSFHSGIYIVKATPSSNTLQVAYGDTAVNWKTAKQIIHGCTVNDIQNIEVKAFITFTNTGTGSLSGKITQASGFGQKVSSGFKPTIPGEPIGGIIVKGGRNPGGQMFVQTLTDPVTGTYTLTNLPQNTGNQSYFILVDIPGLDTNNTYHRIIDVNNNNFTNLDFTVDSAKINPIYDAYVSVKSLSAIENKIKVFPNPASSSVNIQYHLQNSALVKIELYDILGKSIKMILPETQQSNESYKKSCETSDLSSGLYFIKITINGSESIIKLSVNN